MSIRRRSGEPRKKKKRPGFTVPYLTYHHKINPEEVGYKKESTKVEKELTGGSKGRAMSSYRFNKVGKRKRKQNIRSIGEPHPEDVKRRRAQNAARQQELREAQQSRPSWYSNY